METVPCNLCGGENYRLAYRQPDALFRTDRWFDVVECRVCGLGFVNPRPSREEIGQYYPTAFFDHFRDHRLHQRRYAAQAAYIPATEFAPQPMLLDIGCANGDFPRYMRERGWSVEGLEISDAAALIEDFPVYRMEFDALALDGPRYDAISAWAVLEHVHDPMSYFRKAAQLLKPNGVFVFLVTNFESLSSRALFREDPPRHLYFFTRRTIASYLARVGLQLQRFDCGRAIYEMVPSNCLYYAIYRYALRRPLAWHDLPVSLGQFARQFTGKGAGYFTHAGIRLTLHYALAHPIAALDRLAAIFFEQWQVYNGSYGTMVCVARKPAASAPIT